MPDGTDILTGAGTGAAVGTAIFPGIGTAIGAGIGAIGSFFSGIFGASAASQAANTKADIIRQQAAFGIQQAAVGIQRQQTQNTQFLGGATASAGASGFQKTGSVDDYLGQLATTLKANTSWEQYSAEKTAGLQRQAAQLVQDTGNLTAASDILGGVTGAVGAINTAGTAMKWWGGGPSSSTPTPLPPVDSTFGVG